jgi:hypothetical protein
MQLDRSAAQRRLTSARERGYLLNLEEKRGRPARWTLGDPLPDEQELLPLDLPSQGCAQSPPKTYTPPNSVSAADPKGSGEGVQVCSDNGERDIDEAEVVIDLAY